MKISREELTVGLLTEACILSEMHDEELHIEYDRPPNMNKELIVQLAALGMAFTYIARKDGVMIAYAMFLLSPDILYQDVVAASQEALFVHPDYRGTLGVKLLKYAEKNLKESGAMFIVQQTMKSNDVSKLYERLGYRESSTKYIKKM